MTETQPGADQTELLPCPFCGAGTTSVVEQGKVWLGMRYSEPSSVVVRHWCDPVKGQPSRLLERVGRDHASAIAEWNRRAPPAAAPAVQTELTDFRSRLADKCTRLAEWEPCDCGCEGNTPKSAKDVALVQAAAALRRSLLSGTRTCVQAGDSHTQEIAHLAASQASRTSECAAGVPVAPEAEPWDNNPDGIQPGQDSPVRMDPGTGAWDAPETDGVKEGHRG